MTETIIIGAGFAGLAAARKLNGSGKDFLILEARDRVGGRSHSGYSEKNFRVDYGATWIGPTQHNVWEWVKELGLKTYNTYDSGKNILFYKGKFLKYSGTIPKIDPISLLNLGLAISRFNKMAMELDIEKPWLHPKAEKYDSMTVQSWMDKNILSKKTKLLFKTGIQTVFAVDPSELSLLFALFYAKSGDNLDALMSIKDGAQQTILKSGTYAIAEGIAKRFQDKIRFSEIVNKIAQNEEGVTIYTKNDKSYQAKNVIITLPPVLLHKINFEPALPPDKIRLYQRMPMGAAMKCFVIYEKPFWRDKGMSGQIVSDEFPVKITFDLTEEPNSPGKLLVFVEGNDTLEFLKFSPEARKEMILQKLIKFLGEEAGNPLDYIDKSWIDEEFSGGCYTGIMPPNTLSVLGYALREPFGRIHFAGTETATRWAGYLDGAIESGYRAAGEVIPMSLR